MLNTTISTKFYNESTNTKVYSDTYGEVSDTGLLNLFTIFVCSCILVVGIVGNTLVLIVFSSRWSRLKICEIFMINLAVADLIGTMVVPTKHIMEHLNYSFHPIGNIGCKMVAFATLSSVSVSAFTLVLISIDRYTIVKWPLREYPPAWKIASSISATWILSLLLAINYFVLVELSVDNPGRKEGTCTNTASHGAYVIHSLYIMFAQVVLPIAIITTLYMLIIKELRKTTQNRLFQSSERERKIRVKRNSRATKLFMVIVIIFYICILPVTVFFMLYLSEVILITESVRRVFTCLEMLKIMNSCVNPIIYSRLHTSFRRMILKLLCSCFFKTFQSYDWGSLRSLRSNTRTSFRSVDPKKSLSDSVFVNKEDPHGRVTHQTDANKKRRAPSLSTASQLTITEQYPLIDMI